MPVYVQMGHSHAIEAVRTGEDSDELEIRDLPGERIFELVFPDEKLTLREMVMTTMATFRKHQRAGHEDGLDVIPPDWARSNNGQLQDELAAEYGLGKNQIPVGYGTEHDSFKRLHMPALTALTALQAALYVPMAVLITVSVFRLTRLQLRTTAAKDICQDCGVEVFKGAKRCRSCSNKARSKATPIIDGKKLCKACGLERSVEDFNAHSETADKLNPRCRFCETERAQAYRERKMAEDPRGYRLARKIINWMNRYGLTHAQYLALLEKQGGGCAICGITPEELGVDFLPVDHNHQTGEVRGLLCDDCNVALGRLKDDPQRVSNALTYLLGIPLMIFMVCKVMLAIRTTSGRDYQANLLGNSSSNGTGVYNPACYIGLTADATAPAAGDVTLPGEIVSGTLIRAIGTFAHTTGASSYTVSKLFTSDQSITINKIGVFNALTSGTLFVETILSPAAVLNSGDQLQIVSTITL